MKKALTLVFTLLIGLTLVGCKPSNRAGEAYRMAFGEAKNLNRLTSDQNTDSEVSDLLVSTYYETDYDWVTAIEKGIASEKGDFSKIYASVAEKSEAKPYSIDDLGYTRILNNAASFPKALSEKNAGVVTTKAPGVIDKEKSEKLTDSHWEITLRDDLQFSDGTKIDTSTVEYSMKQYLNPDLLAVRGNHIYESTYLNLVGAEAYYFQKTEITEKNEEGEDVPTGEFPEPVAWESVGFDIVDQYTFRIKANSESTQWSLMSNLTVFDLVHPEKFEAGYNTARTTTTYGSLDNLPVSYGPYVLTSWEQDQKFTFKRNEKYHAKDKYQILEIDGPIITRQGTIIEEFKAGNLDVAPVSGVYFPDFVDNPGLYITPSSSFFRLDLSIDRSRDNTQSRDHESKILKEQEFRTALMVGMDRAGFAEGPSAPAEPLIGYVSNIHRPKEDSATYYNSTTQHLDVVEDMMMSENDGYNPTEAKRLFDLAFAAAGYKPGEIAKVEYAYYDVESNDNSAKWFKAHFETLFGTDKFEWVNKGRGLDEHTIHLESGDFDMAFSGLSGGTYQGVSLFDMVYGSGRFYEGRGFDIRGQQVGEVVLDNVYADLMAIPSGERTEEQVAFLEKVENGIFTGTFLELSTLYNELPYFEKGYEGRDEDLYNMMAALEASMLRLAPSIPLFSSVGAAVYSEHVEIFPPAWSNRLSWGGMQYRRIVK